MTTITELSRDDELIGFRIEGHANYSIPGRDIVCAAVSTLTINTINSIAEIAGIDPVVSENDNGTEYYVQCKIDIVMDTLLRSAQIGYKSISEQYPDNVVYGERR